MSNDVDLVWSVEFVEHVDSQYVDNFMNDISKGKYAIITHAIPEQPGHHHVNCQHIDYWIDVFSRYGFSYDSEETQIIRNISLEDYNEYMNWLDIDPSDRVFRTFASNESESNANKLKRSQAHVAENAIFFKKK